MNVEMADFKGPPKGNLQRVFKRIDAKVQRHVITSDNQIAKPKKLQQFVELEG
jgi:hypothetical protein